MDDPEIVHYPAPASRTCIYLSTNVEWLIIKDGQIIDRGAVHYPARYDRKDVDREMLKAEWRARARWADIDSNARWDEIQSSWPRRLCRALFPFIK